MSRKRVVILDGAPARDARLERVLELLITEFERDGAQVEVIAPRSLSLTYCKGCFGCWLETPGTCVEADAGREVTRAVARSDTTVLFTPVRFGGYASDLKHVVDRLVPLALPFFATIRGETHHVPRYLHRPRLVGVGVLPEPDHRAEKIFRVLVGRNAINFHAPSHAAEVVCATDGAGVLSDRFRDLLSRIDKPPFGTAVTSLFPAPDADFVATHAAHGHRVLLIVGSPKTKSPSTSGVLGNHLLRRLEGCGWQAEALTLRDRSLGEAHRPSLLEAVDRADLLVLAFPLYIDALPYLVTRALEIIADHRRTSAQTRPQRLVAIVNNGFPEPHQNALALAICGQFAAECGIEWAGGLAMGAGEALSSGRPLSATPALGAPPVRHVMRALDLTADALAAGHPVPAAAVTMIGASPLPFVPLAGWRWIFKLGGEASWRRQAAALGVSAAGLLARPDDAGASKQVR